MIIDFFKALVTAYLAPRASAAAILSTGCGLGTAALMVVLAYILTTIILMLTPGLERPENLSFVDRHVFGLMSSFASFFIVSFLIYFFGKVSGGTGTREETQLIVAWHSVVTSILSPPVNLMLSQFSAEERDGAPPLIEVPDAGTIGLAVVALLIWFWLLANYITVLHRFHNFWGVAAVVIGLPIGLGFFVFNVIGALSALPQQGFG